MQRRTFLKNAGIISLGLSSLGFHTIKEFYGNGHTPELASLSPQLQEEFRQLLLWMRTQGWSRHLEKALGVNLDISPEELLKELVKPLDEAKLNTLRSDMRSGYDDFSGESLVQPGFPAHSLLFHAMASPRVRPEGIKNYPSLTQLDTLENIIYALSEWNELKSVYGIKSHRDLVFAVFAYEYRPAFKTPHHAYADMVYSRTGIARIGNEPLHYDAVNRCHTDRPQDASREKRVAVIPARYGVFIARKVRMNDISLVRSKKLKPEGKLYKDVKDDRHDDRRFFLQPIRKLFDNDMLTGNMNIGYSETHQSEKLVKLYLEMKLKMYNRPPTRRGSIHLIEQENNIRRAGASFLVVSKKEELIRPAREKGEILFFKVPPKKWIPIEDYKYANRYFTAWATQEVEDVELLTEDRSAPLTRMYNDYSQPRNKPMFVNITNKKYYRDDSFSPLARTPDERYENFINKGGYYAPLFEDSICDGCVEAELSALKLDSLPGISKKPLPAFSIVTAPDFFPQVDPLDLVDFDIAPGTQTESNFYEGGVASLATARIQPNPKMVKPQAEVTRDTYLAVFSGLLKQDAGTDTRRRAFYSNPATERDYEISSYLPDVASSVFAPGWDVTYCGPKDINRIYVSTEGLGSPFVEDMKFCSALNGMWPATSPDAARTYQGSNESDYALPEKAQYRNPTAIPLLDHELGFCGDGPAGKANETRGWDGEQGPYLEMVNNKWKINFTDIGRADAVNNALDGLLDASHLRKLKSAELIARMQCLRLCIHSLPQLNFREGFTTKQTGYTYLWLVNAEKVNWGNEDVAAINVPENLVGNNKDWLTKKANARVNGEGYLFIFVNSEEDNEHLKDWAPGLKRRRLSCSNIYVCQVTRNGHIAWGEVKNGAINFL